MNTRLKRHIASLMLGCWLFALGAAWANACVLQDRGAHGHAADAVADRLAAGTQAVSAGHDGVIDDHGLHAAPGTALCLKACDDRSQSLVKTGASMDLPDLPTPTTVWVIWTDPVMAQDAARAARIDPPGAAEPPLRIRLSRLSL